MHTIDHFFKTTKTNRLPACLFASFWLSVILYCSPIAETKAQSGAALNFDGSNDYVKLNDNDLLTGSYTKEAWVRVPSYAQTSANILSSFNRHFIYINGDKLTAGNNVDYIGGVSNSTPFPLNQWVHVAVTYDAATFTMRLYQDGVLVDTDNSVATISGAMQPLFAGVFNLAQPVTQFLGTMDEVRIWNLVRTPTQISQPRNCELTGIETGLIAYYKCDQGQAGADNTGIGISLNAVVGPIGELTNFAMNGATSNFVAPGGVLTGTNCTFWNNAWSPRSPLSIDNAIIVNTTPSSPITFECNDLTVDAGITLQVVSGSAVTVNGRLDYSNSTIEVQPGGAFIQALASVNTVSTASSRFRVLRDDAKENIGYNMIASPVAGITMGSIGNNSGFTGFRFTHAPANASGARWVATPGSAVLAPGTGFTYVQPSGSKTLTFVNTDGVAGRPHNGPYNVTLTGAAGYNFNLLGNPYPSPVNLDRLLEDNDANISGTAWFWNDIDNGSGTGSYLAVNLVTAPNDPIAVGQGFFVNATVLAVAPNFFNNAQRVDANPTFYRTEVEMTRFRLSVRHTSGSKDQLWVAFSDQFTNRFENGYDAEKFEGATTLSIAAKVGDQRLAIAALANPLVGQSFELPLTLLARESGAYAFTAENVPQLTTHKLFLEDRATGEFYYLQVGKIHTLNLQAGNYRDRFYLRRSNEVQTAQTGGAATAYAFNNELYIETSEKAQVIVFSTMGVEMKRYADVPAGGLQKLAINVPVSGVYLVTILTASGVSERRVWLEK